MRTRPHSRLLATSVWIFLIMTGLCGAGWFGGDSRNIVIVQGTSSLSDLSETNLASQLAKQMDTWLTDVGAPHTLITDKEVSPWRFWRTRAVILPYNPHPSPLELKTFERVIRSGGILLVFYGTDDALASLMEVKLGAYQSTSSKYQWTSFEFDRTRLPGLPQKVFQVSQHLIPVLPDSGTAHVLARWLDARGAPTPEAAWVQSKAGFWMSHVLQPGDDENKSQMLLAMLNTVFPDLWTQAAAYRLSPRRPFGEYESLKAACRDLGQRQPASINQKTEWESYQAAQAWLMDLTRIYSRKNLTNTFSLRGVWVDESACPSPESWPSIETCLQRHQLNTVFFHMGNPLTLRPSAQRLPDSVLAHRRLDKKTTPALHAWLSCMNLEGASPDQLKWLRDQNRLQVSDTGETLHWLCPSHPDNRTLLAEAATALARDPVFSGIHLDYIRYLNRHACYCAGCRQRFEQMLGRPISRWPEAACSGPLTQTYQAWRAAQISTCVSIMSKAIQAVNPQLQISAAVYGATPACFASVGQDWPDWLRRDSVNFVCPMNYTSDLKAFQTLLAKQRRVQLTHRIFPGVGLISSQSLLTPDQAAAQLILIQKNGFQGFVLFEYNQGMETTNIPYLNTAIQ